MQFLLIISHNDAFAPTEKLFGEISAWITEMERRGVRKYGNPLQPAKNTKTVRIRKRKVHILDGPFTDSEEKMCAYELLDCVGMDEAVEAASQHPMAKAATIEVRPVWAELVKQT